VKTVASHTKKTPSKALVNKNGYAVQVALFIEQANAIALVKRLKAKGYRDATYTKVAHHKKTVYKVFVGKRVQKQQAVHVQKQLAAAMQLKGFIVTTEIS
jgi:DedD protein